MRANCAYYRLIVLPSFWLFDVGVGKIQIPSFSILGQIKTKCVLCTKKWMKLGWKWTNPNKELIFFVRHFQSFLDEIVPTDHLDCEVNYFAGSESYKRNVLVWLRRALHSFIRIMTNNLSLMCSICLVGRSVNVEKDYPGMGKNAKQLSNGFLFRLRTSAVGWSARSRRFFFFLIFVGKLHTCARVRVISCQQHTASFAFILFSCAFHAT